MEMNLDIRKNLLVVKHLILMTRQRHYTVNLDKCTTNYWGGIATQVRLNLCTNNMQLWCVYSDKNRFHNKCALKQFQTGSENKF
jgi:hypothetical protein